MGRTPKLTSRNRKKRGKKDPKRYDKMMDGFLRKLSLRRANQYRFVVVNEERFHAGMDGNWIGVPPPLEEEEVEINLDVNPPQERRHHRPRHNPPEIIVDDVEHPNRVRDAHLERVRELQRYMMW